jgi:hypothetical protein
VELNLHLHFAPWLVHMHGASLTFSVLQCDAESTLVSISTNSNVLHSDVIDYTCK